MPGIYFSLLVIYHDIVWLYIAVHDSFAVAEVQGLQSQLENRFANCSSRSADLEQFKNVIPNVIVHKLRIETSKVRIVDVLEY